MKLKNLTKKLTTLAITALMATTLVSTQNVLAASKKAQKKGLISSHASVLFVLTSNGYKNTDPA